LIKSLKLGKFNIRAVETGLFCLDGGAMFGVAPKNIWAKKYNTGDEQNRIPLAARPLIVEFDDKKILIDTGNGNKYSEKLVNIYGFDLEKSNIDYALKTINITRNEITDVILTHLHFDHAGGSTMFDNGELIPSFPNAKYYVQKDNYKWSKNATEKDRASFMPENYEPIISAGMMEFLDGDGELFPGINLINFHGHTKAMQLVKLVDGNDSMLFLADLSPTQAHLNPAFSMGYDNFPLTTIEERKKYLAQAYEEHTILFFEHDAFMHAARLKANAKGFEVGEIINL
jgi:glyoxylase-like metal-dependent hydrolase (beta-lactamase superfamily II)